MRYPNGSTKPPKISSPFGPRDPRVGISGFHRGADLVGFTKIHAIAPGRVTRAGWMNAAAGNTVTIDHGGGVTSIYMHNATHAVKRGDRVTEGQHIATMGRTGNASGKCCHLEIRLRGTSVDPIPYIAQRITTAAPAHTTTDTNQEDTSMIICIKGKKGERRGGLYYVAGGKATFIGARRVSAYPLFTDEGEIRTLQSVISGLR